MTPCNYNRPTGQLLPDDTYDFRQETVTLNCMHPKTLVAGHFSAPHQPHQIQRAYQANVKEGNYKRIEEAATDEPVDACYAGYDQNNNDHYYASDYCEEVFVNFHGIESVWSNCHQCFSSRL